MSYIMLYIFTEIIVLLLSRYVTFQSQRRAIPLYCCSGQNTQMSRHRISHVMKTDGVKHYWYWANVTLSHGRNHGRKVWVRTALLLSSFPFFSPYYTPTPSHLFPFVLYPGHLSIKIQYEVWSVVSSLSESGWSQARSQKFGLGV